eukprot:COSAG05_NODE_10944_length_538_cov_0.792711_1_plen_49_part_10
MQQGRGSRTHETRPSGWGSSPMIDLRPVIDSIESLAAKFAIGTLPLASD